MYLTVPLSKAIEEEVAYRAVTGGRVKQVLPLAVELTVGRLHPGVGVGGGRGVSDVGPGARGGANSSNSRIGASAAAGLPPVSRTAARAQARSANKGGEHGPPPETLPHEARPMAVTFAPRGGGGAQLLQDKNGRPGGGVGQDPARTQQQATAKPTAAPTKPVAVAFGRRVESVVVRPTLTAEQK